MADRWLRRLELVNNIPRNNRNKRRIYHFDLGNYAEEQFLFRFSLTKDGFCMLLDIPRQFRLRLRLTKDGFLYAPLHTQAIPVTVQVNEGWVLYAPLHTQAIKVTVQVTYPSGAKYKRACI